MGRFLGIDYGTVRIGLALSDERAILASPLPFFSTRKTLEDTAKNLAHQFLEYGVLDGIVIGLPLRLSGLESALSLIVRQLGELLTPLCESPISFWDERLSSVQAERQLKEVGLRRKKRAALVDSLSAVVILQSFLDLADM
jgi:putative Holliday junction resolvase